MSRRRGSDRTSRVLVAGVVVAALAVGFATPTTSFSTATVERSPSADVVTADAVLSVDAADELPIGSRARLADVTNRFGEPATVTVSIVSGESYGRLVADGDSGDTVQFDLADGTTTQVDFDPVCEDGAVGATVRYDVAASTDGASGTVRRNVTLTDSDCGATTRSVAVVSVGSDDGRLQRTTDDATRDFDVTGVAATAPQRFDLDDDGDADVPYTTSGGAVRLVDAGNETTTLVSDGAKTAPTRMAVGTWNGSDPSVFYVDGDAVYRVTQTGSPTKVFAATGNGVNAVSGVGDVDGDGAAEFVYLGGSAQLRYYDDDGSLQAIANGGTGVNNGPGVGGPTDFDGDGTARVPFVDGSNNLKLVDASGETTKLTGGVDKAPVGTYDQDGDDTPEVVYVDGGTLHYVDDVTGTPTTSQVTVNGSGVPVEGATGAA